MRFLKLKFTKLLMIIFFAIFISSCVGEEDKIIVKNLNDSQSQDSEGGESSLENPSGGEAESGEGENLSSSNSAITVLIAKDTSTSLTSGTATNIKPDTKFRVVFNNTAAAVNRGNIALSCSDGSVIETFIINTNDDDNDGTTGTEFDIIPLQELPLSKTCTLTFGTNITVDGSAISKEQYLFTTASFSLFFPSFAGNTAGAKVIGRCDSDIRGSDTPTLTSITLNDVVLYSDSNADGTTEINLIAGGETVTDCSRGYFVIDLSQAAQAGGIDLSSGADDVEISNTKRNTLSVTAQDSDGNTLTHNETLTYCTSFNSLTTAVSAPTDIDSDGFIDITSVEEWYKVVVDHNSSHITNNYEVSQDLDFSCYSFKGFNHDQHGSGKSFQGNFNGNADIGVQIKNISQFDQEGFDTDGLFSLTKKTTGTQTIENIYVTGANPKFTWTSGIIIGTVSNNIDSSGTSGGTTNVENIIVELGATLTNDRFGGIIGSKNNGGTLNINYAKTKGFLANFTNANKNYHAGIIAFMGNGTHINQAHFNGILHTDANFVSGIIGGAAATSGNPATVSNASHVGSIIAKTSLAGIAGDSGFYNTLSDVYMRGHIIGHNGVTGTGNSLIGGIIGKYGGNVTIRRAYAHAYISHVSKYAGGIMGSPSSFNNVKNITVDQVYSVGKLYSADTFGGQYLGGIAGRFLNALDNRIVNSYSRMTFHSDNTSPYIGGLSGSTQNTSDSSSLAASGHKIFVNSYYAGDPSSACNVTGICSVGDTNSNSKIFPITGTPGQSSLANTFHNSDLFDDSGTNSGQNGKTSSELKDRSTFFNVSVTINGDDYTWDLADNSDDQAHDNSSPDDDIWTLPLSDSEVDDSVNDGHPILNNVPGQI